MSDQGKHDRANTKPGDLRAEMTKRVGLTVEEQNRCRREGFSAAWRFLRGCNELASYELYDEGERRWGPDWEVDG